MKPIKYALRFGMMAIVSLITNGCADIDDDEIDHDHHGRTRTTTTTTTEERHVAPPAATVEETHVTRY
jgi:hypothetical protein